MLTHPKVDAVLDRAALWLAIRAAEADVPHDDRDAMAAYLEAVRYRVRLDLGAKFVATGFPLTYAVGGPPFSPEIRVECAADSFRGLVDGAGVHEFRDGVGRDVDPREARR